VEFDNPYEDSINVNYDIWRKQRESSQNAWLWAVILGITSIFLGAYIGSKESLMSPPPPIPQSKIEVKELVKELDPFEIEACKEAIRDWRNSNKPGMNFSDIEYTESRVMEYSPEVRKQAMKELPKPKH
jgi:hypothetical protein